MEAAIDGEGSVSFTKRKPTPSSGRVSKRGFGWRAEVRLFNCDADWIKKAREIVGEGLEKQGGYTRKGRPYFVVYWSHNTLRWLLPQLKLVIKERKRQILVEALALLKEHKVGYTPNDVQLEKLYREYQMLGNLKTGPSVWFTLGA